MRIQILIFGLKDKVPDILLVAFFLFPRHVIFLCKLSVFKIKDGTDFSSIIE